ncbi:MAG: PorT family protein [Paludibacteraceae bacterium]|nr:PorT family protein [Paludibacteraceae bacterium]
MKLENAKVWTVLFCVLASFFSFASVQAKTDGKDVVKQLIENAHGGVEVHDVDGHQSLSGYVGTGYRFYLDDKNRLYVYPAIDIKWGEYRADGGGFKSTSVALPITMGYKLFDNEAIRMDLFGGVTFEQILSVTDNDISYGEVNRSQAGLNGGTTIRLLNKFSINASYYYGLTSLFNDGNGCTRSYNFSINF